MTRWAIGSLPDLSLCNSGTDLESGTKKDLVTQDSSSSAQPWTGLHGKSRAGLISAPGRAGGHRGEWEGKIPKDQMEGGCELGSCSDLRREKPFPPMPRPDIDLCFDHGGNLHSSGRGFVLLFCFLGT